MLLWASMLSRSLITPVNYTAVRFASVIPSLASISTMSTQQLIGRRTFFCGNPVHQALAIRFATMGRFDYAKDYLPSEPINLDDHALEDLVSCEFDPEKIYGTSILESMRKEGEGAYFAPGECQERLATACVYQLALNGNAYVLRTLILRHWYAKDYEGAYHLLKEATYFGYSEDWLLCRLLDYGDNYNSDQFIKLLPDTLDVTQYLKGQKLFEQAIKQRSQETKPYQDAYEYFQLAAKQGLPGAQKMVDEADAMLERLWLPKP